MAYIKSNFEVLTLSIIKIQTKNRLLTGSLNIILEVKSKRLSLKGFLGKTVHLKLQKVLEKNAGLKVLEK